MKPRGELSLRSPSPRGPPYLLVQEAQQVPQLDPQHACHLEERPNPWIAGAAPVAAGDARPTSGLFGGLQVGQGLPVSVQALDVGQESVGGLSVSTSIAVRFEVDTGELPRSLSRPRPIIRQGAQRFSRRQPGASPPQGPDFDPRFDPLLQTDHVTDDTHLATISLEL